jgi:hypothetical protein
MQRRLIVPYCLTDEDGTDMFSRDFGKKLKLLVLISIFTPQFKLYVTVSCSSPFYELVYNTFLCLPTTSRSETPIGTESLNSIYVRASQS